ncbi:MAG: hypothetical protein KDD70_16965 [Bdellovibrionales bacterium]|nr:hypothetical protein [Bdellovibrionales bacterium]
MSELHNSRTRSDESHPSLPQSRHPSLPQSRSVTVTKLDSTASQLDHTFLERSARNPFVRLGLAGAVGAGLWGVLTLGDRELPPPKGLTPTPPAREAKEDPSPAITSAEPVSNSNIAESLPHTSAVRTLVPRIESAPEVRKNHELSLTLTDDDRRIVALFGRYPEVPELLVGARELLHVREVILDPALPTPDREEYQRQLGTLELGIRYSARILELKGQSAAHILNLTTWWNAAAGDTDKAIVAPRTEERHESRFQGGK